MRLMDKSIDRRELLKTTTGILTGLVVTGSPLAIIARGRVWAVDLTALTYSEGAALMAMARTILPHDKLEDAAYALAVQAIDADARNDQSFLKMLREGVASLGPDFTKNSESDRVATLKKMEASTFFRAVRQKAVQILYATPLAYSYFGYEGEAFSKGGYLMRGFNDLRWLPEVPLPDSGPLPVGG